MKLSIAPLTMLVSVVTLTTASVACRKASAEHQKKQGLSAAQLINQANQHMKNGKWEEARKVLRTIEEQLPSSKEFPAAKMLLGDSYFFQNSPSYPEALVEYHSFINYFPTHEKRDLALYRIAQCHYGSIENAERDQTETRKALEAFQQLLNEAPGSAYTVDAKNKITQCWRRLAEHELVVGIQYVNSYHFAGAERRLKQLMETYPDYVDRERAYFYLGEAMRQKYVPTEVIDQYRKDFLSRTGKDDYEELSREEFSQLREGLAKFQKEEIAKYREEAKSYYQKVVESYPNSDSAGRAKDHLLDLGQSNVKEELDS